jgi:hypothetical protein
MEHGDMTRVTYFLAAIAAAAAPARAAAQLPAIRVQDVRAELTALADDSMQGRMTASPGGARAARYIARRMQEIGLQPAGDSGFFQRVPLARSPHADDPSGLVLLRSRADLDSVLAAARATAVNVVGILPGSDPKLRGEAILVDAHYDHLGIGEAVGGDSIYNGADDDASGTVAVLEIARALAAGPRPKRTVVFLATTGEEVGLLGTQWYIGHPVVPLERTVANLEIEMIGRPDSLAGGRGKGWLTGFERSTMGSMFAAAGIPIVADPHPAQSFFTRSDNIAFARRGIPAHTLSSYDLHTDYHTPGDEADRVDLEHMTAVIRAGARAVRLLADGPVPTWNPGGRPAPEPARR